MIEYLQTALQTAAAVASLSTACIVWTRMTDSRR